MENIEIYDSTLRDGAQGEGIIFSLKDKINIIMALDRFGVNYIEAGNPGSNPKDAALFAEIDKLALKNAKVTAFGSTRRKEITVEEDANLIALAECSCKYVTIFGKAWRLHVEDILKTSLKENLRMISESIEYLTKHGKTVFFDAEHFFDACKDDPKYTAKILQCAEKSGAKRIILCDTNGGCFPDEIAKYTQFAIETVKIPVGIHCHNDTECAVANTISAVKSGAEQIQGTFVGFGERCGNTNLSSVIPALILKLGINCGKNINIEELTKTARYVAEISNINLIDNMPYIGKSAFSHKGGMHVDGVRKNPKSFEHIDPLSVGNKRNFLISEVSGRTVIMTKISRFAPQVAKDSVEARQIIDLIKLQESRGFHYEAAEASFEILVKKYLGMLENFFEIESFKVIGENYHSEQLPSSAIVKVRVGDSREMGAEEGEGPINAIDKALRNALCKFYPSLNDMHLIDYKVRVVDSNAASAALVRVLIESTDGSDVWTTVGASADIITGSAMALIDSIQYKLMRDSEKRRGVNM